MSERAEFWRRVERIVALLEQEDASPAVLLAVAAAFAKRATIPREDFMRGAEAAYEAMAIRVVRSS